MKTCTVEKLMKDILGERKQAMLRRETPEILVIKRAYHNKLCRYFNKMLGTSNKKIDRLYGMCVVVDNSIDKDFIIKIKRA